MAGHNQPLRLPAEGVEFCGKQAKALLKAMPGLRRKTPSGKSAMDGGFSARHKLRV
jgi:hypothetical protein